MTNTLSGKRILLGVTGGIAAYKSAELTRLLVKAGATVRVMLSDAATEFVTPMTLQALSRQSVATSLWESDSSVTDDAMAHIALTRNADLVLLAPATANVLAKLANGIADDLLSTTCLARDAARCPLFVAPAMNREMWDQAATRRNVAQLMEDGVQFIGPEAGEQACGEVGFGRMTEPADIISALNAFFEDKYRQLPLFGIKALVTAGPTFEAIDAVRGITNSSSGKMGYAIADALRDLGASVTLVSGPTALAVPTRVQAVRVTSASEMLTAVNDNLSDVKLFFAVAAVADYTPAHPKNAKIKKGEAALTIELTPTVDILTDIASRPNAPFCIGFAAETNDIITYASEKRLRKRLPMIVANDSSKAIGADDNAVTIIDDQGTHVLPRQPKTQVAREIVAHAIRLYEARQNSAKLN